MKIYFKHLKYSSILLSIGIASLFSSNLIVDMLGGMILGSGLAFLMSGIVLWKKDIKRQKELLEKGADAL